MRVSLEAKFRNRTSALYKPSKAPVVKGDPRSEVKTKGDLGSCSRYVRPDPSCRNVRDPQLRPARLIGGRERF